LDSENLYERIRDEIRDSPLFRFDWFFLSRTPVEIGRRCTTLLNTVAREFGDPDEKLTNGHAHGKGRGRDRDESEDIEEEEEEAPAKKKVKNGAVNKKIKSMKSGTGSKATSPATSRAQSVSSTAPTGKGKKGKNHK